jgi:hypothetical protein
MLEKLPNCDGYLISQPSTLPLRLKGTGFYSGSSVFLSHYLPASSDVGRCTYWYRVPSNIHVLEKLPTVTALSLTLSNAMRRTATFTWHTQCFNEIERGGSFHPVIMYWTLFLLYEVAFQYKGFGRSWLIRGWSWRTDEMERGASQHKAAGLVERNQASRPFVSVSFVTGFYFSDSLVSDLSVLWTRNSLQNIYKNKIRLNVTIFFTQTSLYPYDYP